MRPRRRQRRLIFVDHYNPPLPLSRQQYIQWHKLWGNHHQRCPTGLLYDAEAIAGCETSLDEHIFISIFRISSSPASAPRKQRWQLTPISSHVMAARPKSVNQSQSSAAQHEKKCFEGHACGQSSTKHVHRIQVGVLGGLPPSRVLHRPRSVQHVHKNHSSCVCPPFVPSCWGITH